MSSSLLFTALAAADVGYRLFKDPLPVWQESRWPWLLLPLVIAVSLVYKSIRCKSMKSVPRETATITVMIILGMGLAAVALAVVVRGLER